MTDDPVTVGDAIENFNVDAEAFIIATALPSGNPGLMYQGNRRQLTALFRLIQDQLREREKIGNHPNRGDVKRTH